VHHSTAVTIPARDTHVRRHDTRHGAGARPHVARPQLIDTHLVRAELLRLRGSHAGLRVHHMARAGARELA